MQEHLNKARDIMQRIKYATLATVTLDGRPWNSPVVYVYDKDLNIYWFSDKESQHSINVRVNSRVFIVIYDSTVPEGQGKGIYIEAKAEELTDSEEVLMARRIKKGAGHEGLADEFLGSAIRRVYKAVPERMWTNSAEIKDGVFLRDYKIEIPLSEIKELLS